MSEDWRRRIAAGLGATLLFGLFPNEIALHQDKPTILGLIGVLGGIGCICAALFGDTDL